MQAITLDLNKSITESGRHIVGADIKLSLRPFIEYVEQKTAADQTVKVNFYKYILGQFNAYPELKDPILPENAKHYTALFELIYTALSPIINEEKQHYWALGTPVSPCFHYGTNAFYNVFMNDDRCGLKPGLDLPSQKDMEKNLLSAFYNIVMEKFYNFSLTGNQLIIHSIVDPETHLLKYYRLNVDTRFLEITTRHKLPE